MVHLGDTKWAQSVSARFYFKGLLSLVQLFALFPLKVLVVCSARIRKCCFITRQIVTIVMVTQREAFDADELRAEFSPGYIHT